MSLSEKDCIPCKGGVPPLKGSELTDLHAQLQEGGREGLTLFELPLSTTLLVFGFPAFWILYTLGFLFFTRRWKRTEHDPEDGK